MVPGKYSIESAAREEAEADGRNGKKCFGIHGAIEDG